MDFIYKTHLIVILCIWGIFKLLSVYKITENMTDLKEIQPQTNIKSIYKQKKFKINQTPKYLSYQQSNIKYSHKEDLKQSHHHFGFIEPKIYTEASQNGLEKITGTNLDTYNLVKNPVRVTNYNSLELRKHRDKNWKKQRIWQQTFV